MRKVLIASSIAFISIAGFAAEAHAFTKTIYYGGGDSIFTLGTNVTVPGSSAPYYGQNNGDYFNAYRIRDVNGSNFTFKFARQAGDTNAYDVALNLTANLTNAPADALVIADGDNTFSSNDLGPPATTFTGNFSNLTTLATISTGGSNTLNNIDFSIPALTQDAYLVIYESTTDSAPTNITGYLESLNVSFATVAVPEPTGWSLLGIAGIALLLPRRRREDRSPAC